jgi:hypothetical protein
MATTRSIVVAAIGGQAPMQSSRYAVAGRAGRDDIQWSTGSWQPAWKRLERGAEMHAVDWDQRK